MNAKRILALLFAVLMLVGCLAACNDGTANTDPTGTTGAVGTVDTFVP